MVCELYLGKAVTKKSCKQLRFTDLFCISIVNMKKEILFDQDYETINEAL